MRTLETVIWKENLNHIDISSLEVTAIPIASTDEELVSAFGLLNCGPPPESPETKDYYHLVRRGVLERLLQAERELPSGLRFRLYEGYRCPNYQESLFQQQLRRVVASNPKLARREAYSTATHLVAPTKTFEGAPLVPPHSTGGAIDIEIVDSKGCVIDFGMEIKDWSSVAPSLCETHTTGLSPMAIKNRAMLLSVMSRAGFVNYSREWWHFSYGDQYWACLSGHSHAYYASVR